MQPPIHRRQRGQTIAVMAVVIVAIVGALAFVVDLGFQMEARRELQNAADAGALAGVVLLPDDQAGSIQQATTFAYQGSNASVTDRICGPAVSPLPDAGATAPAAHANVYSKATPGQMAVTGGNIYTMTVTMECTTNFSFGRILNLTTAPIRASATAALGSPTYVGCTFPMWVYDKGGDPTNGLQNSLGWTYQGMFALYGKWSGGSSNAGLLQTPSGKSPGDIAAAVAGNCGNAPDVSTSGCSPVQAPCAEVDTGNKFHAGGGLTDTTSQYPNGRMVDCSIQAGAYCGSTPTLSLPDGGTDTMTSVTYSCAQQYSDVVNPNGTVKNGKANSPCLAVVPITDTTVGSGNQSVHIEGYAIVFLAAFQSSGSDPLLAAQFVRNMEFQSDIAAYNPLGSYAIRLIS